ncbi:helix-turn-helix domain-containing protein [Eubacteriales bacterium OttesenSCG-928-M02]|nr:helix-turn-helix domain-containing protein [Eubacteriales bacterium OttesenSCG-928-M02]
MQSIGERIRYLRERQDLTQRELADMAGITIATLSRYENGQRTPMSDLVVKLARALHTTTDFLLTGEGDEQRKQKEYDGAINVIGFASSANDITPHQASLLEKIAKNIFHIS